MNSNAQNFAMLVLLLCSCGGSVDNASARSLGDGSAGGSGSNPGSIGEGGIAATSHPEAQGGLSSTGGGIAPSGQGSGGSGPLGAIGAAGYSGVAGVVAVAGMGDTGQSAFGGTAGTVGHAGRSGAAGATGTRMDCGWEEIVCGSLSPTCTAEETYVHAAACSGPCVSTSRCQPNWSANQDVLTVGVWVIGWQGDAPHYTQLRFSADSTLEFAAPSGMLANQPYFSCMGIGNWAPLPMQGTIHVGFPAGCSDKSTALRFEGFYSADGYWGAAMRAVLRGGDPVAVEAYWFPTGRCDDSATDCPI